MHVRDLADIPRGQVLVEGGGTVKHYRRRRGRRRPQCERRGRERGGHQYCKARTPQQQEREGERTGGEREVQTEERTPRPTTRRRRRRDRTDDSLECMVVTLLTFHEDRFWLKAEANQNTRRRRGRKQV